MKPKHPTIYVVACANGSLHIDGNDRAYATMKRTEANLYMEWADTEGSDRADEEDGDCGPHRVVAHVPRERRQTADDNEAEMAAVGTAPSTDADLAADERMCAIEQTAFDDWCEGPGAEIADDYYVSHVEWANRARIRYPTLVTEVRRLRADLAKVMAEREEARGDATRFLSCIETEREKAAELAALVTAAFARDRAERDALRAEVARLRAALEWIGTQPCSRAPEDDGTERHCPTSGDCITEWCLPCYARAAHAPPPATDADPYAPRLSVSYPLNAPTSPLGEPGVLTTTDMETPSPFEHATTDGRSPR